MTTPIRPVDSAAPAEVFEIVDRLTGKRATEVVYLTGTAALDQLQKWVADYGKPEIVKQYRVQSVRVHDA